MAERDTSTPLAAPVRLGRRHKRVALLTLVLIWGSGALWLLFHYFHAGQGPFGPEPHPLEAWWLRLHGLAMMLSLAVLGSVLSQHAARAWRLRRNRFPGGALTAVALWLATTGYALYYFPSDANDAWLPLLHWLPGLALPAIVVTHVRTGRRRKPAAHGTPHPAAVHRKQPPASHRSRSQRRRRA